MISRTKHLVFLILTFITSFNALKITAQSGRIYDDLLVLLVNEDYKDCFNKSVKYTLKDKTKKDPLPYLFAAKASFEMSRDHQYTEEFPKAYKEVLKMCMPKIEEYGNNKFSLKYMNESQQFILRFTLMEFANYYKDKDAAKAKTMMDYGKHLFYDENYFSKISYSMDYKLIYDHL